MNILSESLFAVGGAIFTVGILNFVGGEKYLFFNRIRGMIKVARNKKK